MEEPLGSGLEDAASGRDCGSKRKKKLQKLSQEKENGHFPDGAYLAERVPNPSPIAQ